jgi:glutaredoxin 3
MKIEIYGAKIKGKQCPWCAKAVALCKEQNLPFEYRDITNDESLKEEFKVRSNNATSVPQIFVGDYIVGGFAELKACVEQGIIQQLVGGE